MSVILSVKNLRFKNILHNISFDIYKSEILALIGANAAGKTTLLRCLLKKKANIAYVPQQKDIFSELRVVEFLDIISANAKNPVNKLATIQLLNLTNLLHKTFSLLSGGEMQRVMLAGAIIKNADLILLDEANAFLDPKEKINLGKILRDLKQKQKSILLVSHDLDFIASYADRIIALKDGRLLFEEDSSTLKRNLMEEVYA